MHIGIDPNRPIVIHPEASGPSQRPYIRETMHLAQGTHSNCIFEFPVFSLFFPYPTSNFPCANLHDL